MANAFYPSGLKKLLDADIDLLVDTIKMALIDTGTYTYSSAHDFLDDVSGVVGTAGTLDNKTTTAGVFDADNEVFSAVSGASVEAVILYKDTGAAGTSPLICYLDGISVTPNGGDITINFNASGIFAIGT